MTELLTIRPVLETPDLLVWEHQGTSDRLVVCFSGVGPDPEVAPGYEFAQTATGDGKDTVLFIADPKRTWLNGPGLIEKIAALVIEVALRVGARTVCTLGHSMGGYAACVLPGFLKVDVAVAMSPQVSVHPEVVADDPRWMNWREQISQFRVQHVADHVAKGTRYFAFFGTHRREAPQRDRFPTGENIELLLMHSTHHNTAQRMRARGILDTVIQAAFDDRIYRVRRLIRRNFGARANA